MEGKGRKEERGQRSNPSIVCTKNVGALKRGRKLFHLLGPQSFDFSSLLKPYFKALPGKAGGTHFWGRRLCYRGAKTRNGSLSLMHF